MSETINTVAAMRRALTPGRKLTVCWEEVVTYSDGRSLRYPTRDAPKARTVEKVRSADVKFRTEAGTASYLPTRGVKVMPREGGFELHVEAFEASVPTFEAMEKLVNARCRGDLTVKPVPASELIRAKRHAVVVYTFNDGATP